MENYISKQTSYDVAHEVAQKAKKVLGLSEYDRETLEHDINNLRAHEWIDLFNMIPDSNEVKKLYFTHCVELENENDQELEEDMGSDKFYKNAFKQLLKLSMNLKTGPLGMDRTYYDEYGFQLESQISTFSVEFDPDSSEWTVYKGSRKKRGKGWKSLIETITDLSFTTWFGALTEEDINYLKSLNPTNSKKSIKSIDQQQELEENIDTFTTIRNKLNRLCSPYQVQLWNNGRFEVYQVKEDDKDRLVNNLRRVSKEVHAAANGKYDFSRPAMFGNLHSQYYNIYGEIEMEDKNESLDLTEGMVAIPGESGFYQYEPKVYLPTDKTYKVEVQIYAEQTDDDEYDIGVEIVGQGIHLIVDTEELAKYVSNYGHPYLSSYEFDKLDKVCNSIRDYFEDLPQEDIGRALIEELDCDEDAVKKLWNYFNIDSLSMKEIIQLVLDKFGKHKQLYKIIGQYCNGNVDIVKFYAPNDYLAAFSLIYIDAPTLSFFETEYEKKELYEIINNCRTVKEVINYIITKEYEGQKVNEKPILLLNVNTDTVLYKYGDTYMANLDDYDWEEDVQELKEDMESNKKLMLVWEHFNPSNINLIYDNDFSRLESYMSTEDDIICEDEGAVESGIFLLAHNDESEMLSFVGHSIEDVKTKFIQAVEQAKVEAQEYEDEDLNLGDPFYYCTDNLNLNSEEMFNEWINWITSSQVDGDSGYAWHLIDVANKQVLYGSQESEVIFYDSVDEYFNDLTGGLDNTEGEELEENTITNTLPPVLDQFLMDCAQMYCNFDYTDISKFGERATEDEIKLLRKIRADLKDGFDEDDPEVKDIFNEIEKIVKGTGLTESVLMEKDPNLTDSQKKYVEDMYNKDMEFYGFASYDSEDDFVEDVTIDFDESEAIEMYKYYKQLHEVNKADESLNRDVVEEPELDESYNPTGIANIAKNLKVNGPRSREDRKPEAIPGYINEINIPDNMRLKSYDFREQDNTLYIEWVTQESFNSEDVNKFIDEVAAAVDFIADSLDFIEEFEAVIEVTSRDGKEYGYAKERLRFEPKGTESEQIEEARSNNSLSARLKARLNKLTECNSEDQLTEEKLSTRLIRRLNQGKINEAPIVEEVTDIDLTEESLKWNMGSNKLVSTDSEEFARLVDLAKLLQEKSPNGFMYTVEKTYEDFGAGMQWYNIICHNKKGDRWQVLNTKQWLELANGKLTVEQSYDSIIKDEYFQDKISGDVNTMNHSQLLKFMDSFDEE